MPEFSEVAFEEHGSELSKRADKGLLKRRKKRDPKSTKPSTSGSIPTADEVELNVSQEAISIDTSKDSTSVRIYAQTQSPAPNASLCVPNKKTCWVCGLCGACTECVCVCVCVCVLFVYSYVGHSYLTVKPSLQESERDYGDLRVLKVSMVNYFFLFYLCIFFFFQSLTVDHRKKQ